MSRGRNGAAALLAAYLEDLPKLGLDRVAVLLGKLQPSRAQLLRLSLVEARKAHVFEQPPPLEVTGQQIVRHLPEEESSRDAPSVIPDAVALLQALQDGKRSGR